VWNHRICNLYIEKIVRRTKTVEMRQDVDAPGARRLWGDGYPVGSSSRYSSCSKYAVPAWVGTHAVIHT